MSETKATFKDKVSSFYRSLAKEEPAYEDAQMLVGGAESEAKLCGQDVLRSIDTEWIDKIEEGIPYLDTVIRNPSVAIEDVEEILPLEMTRKVSERSVKHLAQHTNLIMDMRGDDIIPSKILNVQHEETYLTYENKFVNTLLSRLSAFVDKRYTVLAGGSGAEKSYKFDYSTSFEHFSEDTGGKNSAKVSLSIELTSPMTQGGEEYGEINEAYKAALARVERIDRMLAAYRSSPFAQKMGRAYIRPPVIRTNAILKNKDMKECLKLWEYIESFDEVGYFVQMGAETMLPSDDFIRDMYGGVALQYLQFYDGIANEEKRLLSKKHLFENSPTFSQTLTEEDFSEYMVYDAEYKKTVPVSLLAKSRKRLSDDEKLMLEEITVSLKADELLTKRRLEEEARRRAEELARKLAEEEAKRREEEERRRREEEELRAAEEAKRLAEEQRRAEEEAKRLAEEEERRRAEEARKLAEEQRRAEEEARKLAEEQERIRAEAEERARIEAEKHRMEEERARFAETEFIRVAAEQEAAERAEDEFYPENGDLVGRYPVCPYTRAQYSALPRKVKKQVKKDMEKVLAYRDTLRRITSLEQRQRSGAEENELRLLFARNNAILRELSAKSGWVELLNITKHL